MIFKHNKLTVPLAKELRKDMTKEEKHLWYDFLKDYPVRFMRQRTMGPYIADFYCAKAKLVIELDGSQHYSDEGLKSDIERTKFLEKEFGIKVIRFSNLDIMQKFEGVCVYIDELVKQSLSQQS